MPTPVDPFAPPYAPPVGQPVGQPPYAYTPAPQHPVATYPTPPQPAGRGLAVTAIVLSSVALLLVLGMALLLFVTAAGASGRPYALSGRVNVTDGAVSGGVLRVSVAKAVEDDGGSVDSIRCPRQVVVEQGRTAVCRGTVDDWDWVGVVVFDDDSGRYLLTEYDLY